MALIARPWALFRQIQYGLLFCGLLALFLGYIYFTYLYTPANCFDGAQNGDERGVDCGGACARICEIDVTQPTVKWAKSFKVTGDQYNAVAYIENKNEVAASPEVAYTFTLYDGSEIIAERSGTTILPPDSEYPIFEARISTNGRVPTRTVLTLEKPELWQSATVGRDQFRVTDRQLFDADGRPRLEATIENKALTEAKETEVIATIFDSRGNALTSSRTFVDNFAPRSQERVVFTWPEPIAKTVRSCEVPTDVVLAIDLSGSMNNDQDTPPEPITSVLSAAKSFAERLQERDQAGVVTFASKAIIAKVLSSDISTIASAIANLRIDPQEEAGSTNTGDALYRAHEELTSVRHNSAARKVLILLTDGLATAPDDEPEAYALEAVETLKNDDIIVYTIGLGEQVNMDFVTQMASAPSQAYRAVSRGDVDNIYKTITGDICEDGAAVIDIVPKTNASFTPLR